VSAELFFLFFFPPPFLPLLDEALRVLKSSAGRQGGIQEYWKRLPDAIFFLLLLLSPLFTVLPAAWEPQASVFVRSLPFLFSSFFPPFPLTSSFYSFAKRAKTVKIITVFLAAIFFPFPLSPFSPSILTPKVGGRRRDPCGTNRCYQLFSPLFLFLPFFPLLLSTFFVVYVIRRR